MSTLECMTMHPRCRHKVHVETDLNDFSSLVQVKIQFQFILYINFLGFHVVVLVKTFPFMCQLLM